MTPDGEVVEEEETAKEVLLPDTTIVTHCIYKNDLIRFTECFENEEDPYKETVQDLMNERDDDGKSPLDIAAILGRSDLSRELLTRGALLDNISEKGYCAWHYAAAWGSVDVLKVLFDFSANFQQKNAFGERARETALRYSKTECVDFLDWAEAKIHLIDLIKTVQESVTDLTKTQGVITKEEKNIAVNCCKEKNEWLEVTTDATTQDFISQRESMDIIVAPIMQKINDPPEKPEKK
ncbi:ankyrin repeat domain-containing protein 45-like [Gigantopelta aegis]|uniref:ankyrin repeat domain-containing protein 45-like n=1 Tax=Gigantopelta aegis TaxID=1735272 RepID=UPI001B88CEE3|nr:ankyrin repeat domain-containing protein 45-like [Gigantopelta aegis]